MITATHKISFQPGRKSKKTISADVDQKPQPPVPLPRITKMMALAIRLDHLIKSGQVTDQAEIARVGHVSRARVTQIMDLLHLAPDIQEQLLFVETDSLLSQIIETRFRTIARIADWRVQRLAMMNQSVHLNER